MTRRDEPVRREKPVSSCPRSVRINWSLAGYFVGGSVIIALLLYFFWETLDTWVLGI